MKKLKSALFGILSRLLFILCLVFYISMIFVYAVLATVSFIFALPIWLLFGKSVYKILNGCFGEAFEHFSKVPDEVNDYLNNKVEHNE